MSLDLIKRSVDALGVDKKYAERLEHAERIIEFTFPLQRDNGETIFLKGFRSQYNSVLGPYKGGIRFHQNVDRDEVVLLSKLMTFKNSLAGIPYGGGKGGVQFNPKEFSKPELERVSRSYVRGLFRFIGPDIDVPAPDVNTNSEIMAWMADEYNTLLGKKEFAAFTGKPVEFNGLKGRAEATGRGAYFIMMDVFKGHNVPKDVSIAVQGFGNVGMNLARILHENGYKVVAVSDSKGGLYDSDGLDIPALIELKKSRKSVHDYERGNKISNEELLELDCDVLVPAALDNQLRKDNADKVNAKYIFEAANNPTTPEADAIFNEKGVIVLPDILVNSGGVSASYLEWVQNREGNVYDYEVVVGKLKIVMDRAFSSVYSEKKKNEKISYREAAYLTSIRRLVSALRHTL